MFYSEIDHKLLLPPRSAPFNTAAAVQKFKLSAQPRTHFESSMATQDEIPEVNFTYIRQFPLDLPVLLLAYSSLILFGKILPATVRKMLKTPRSCINIHVLEAMQTASAILC